MEASIAAAQQGDITRHYQLGHPFGVPEYGYAAEVGLGRIIADPGGWVTNEKGAVLLAASLPTAPARFAERAARITGDLGQASAELNRSIGEAVALVADTRAGIAAGTR
ncbi:hypothetical protein [Cryobacterium tepidiphilum]|uniref:Uncharacterized protein n=1 Tax=Cryobacterium tepidiphilum TaxID=2486026 RepID=A0A3M8LGJ6_9MICO|nr:hypothetical protein [Cryobacterium tepidiphilum]RNE64019.1 hypothetical protein EEJ31_05490 [Cryobacterium tepidiphilum]